MNLLPEKKELHISIYIILILFGFTSCRKENRIQLVNDGTANYEIVVPEDATAPNLMAAGLIKKYIDTITGSAIQIVDKTSLSQDKKKIYVENNSGDRLNTHELSIKTDHHNIFISGGSDEATQQAALVFLEGFLGCRWYAPGVEGFPKSRSLALKNDIDFTYQPSITTRTVHSRLFYEHPDFAAKHKVTNEAFPTYVPSARVHTFHKFIPGGLFFDEHPDYYALRGDKRMITQLCLTNEDVFEIVKDSVASLFRQYPDAKVISVSQDDNQQYCECENCSTLDEKEGSHAGTMIHFVNRIAKAFPDKTISTLAYQYTRRPPKVKPEKNVLITLCSIECDRSGPIQDKCQDFAGDVAGWGKLTDNIRIWDYTTQFTNFLAPFPNLYTLQPNIRFLRDQHTKWIFEQHSHHPSELFELRSYLMANLLWNPDTDFERLIEEFTDGYYQEAGVHIRNYITLIHEKLAENNDFFLFLYGDPSQAFDSYLSAALLEKYDGIFDDAEKAVADKPEVLKRVKAARLSTDYAILEASKKELSVRFSLTSKDKDGKKIYNPEVEKRLENFMNICENNDIVLMNEMGFTVEEYFSTYKNTLKRAVLPNKAKGKKVQLITRPKKYANENPQTLTDGALGGNNFYANWLGFEGNHLDVVIDLEAKETIHTLSTAFLKVTNHLVFYPLEVTYLYSVDGKNFIKLGTIDNKDPLTPDTKVNEIQLFDLKFKPVEARYIKVFARNMNEAPFWHHGSGSPSWIFADEIIIN